MDLLPKVPSVHPYAVHYSPREEQKAWLILFGSSSDSTLTWEPDFDQQVLSA